MMHLARDFAPAGRIRCREGGVAVEVGVDLGDDQLVGLAEPFRIELRAADQERLGRA